MVTAAVEGPANIVDGESRFVLYGVPWSTYVVLRDALDHAGLEMTYLRGTLELVRPSTLHADAKKIIARLVEAWAMEHDFDLRGFGGATFRREAKAPASNPTSATRSASSRTTMFPTSRSRSS